MADIISAEIAAVPIVQFGRPGKKRKAYRQRRVEDDAIRASPAVDATEEGSRPARKNDGVDSNDKSGEEDDDSQGKDGKSNDNNDNENGNDGEENGDDDDEEDGLGVPLAELIRQKRQRKSRFRGVEFRSDGGEGVRRGIGGAGGAGGGAVGFLAAQGAGGDYSGLENDMDLIPARFAPPTGLVGELVNKHMEEYVEKEMAKRYQSVEGSPIGVQNGKGRGLSSGFYSSSSTAAAASTAASGDGGGGDSGPNSKASREQLAMKGKLHEIDLGAEARARNIAMTEKATRRLRGNSSNNDNNSSNSSSKDNDTAGGGEDGGPKGSGHGHHHHQQGKKPANGSSQRTDEDLERDKLVEQFLHENKMDVDVYDVAKEPSTTAEGRPTDDRIAEQFRRDFMEALAQRLRRRRRPLGPPAKPKPTRNEDEILRGPKLGGSRNVRSAMRDKLLQKQEEERQSIPKYEQELQEQRRRANRRR